ncbi:Do family serine endopeptidase [Blastomonas sp.]|uniref:Do family serine endopeptidase n=1 Tax=Blastomonas sp. TaxID=1909299 RepID=UPI00359410C7
MRYAYAVTTALLLGGSTIVLATGQPLGAQVAQNDQAAMQAATPRAGAPMSFADLTEQLQPAVVNISTRQRVRVPNNPFAGTPFGGLFGDQGAGGTTTREAQSLGSGFIISSDGYVVTNNHVVAAEGRAVVEAITVTMPDGTEYPARLIGRDPQSDLAVLKINGTTPFPFVRFGDSTKTRVGDWIIAIGNPFGLGGTVTSGIISAVYRNTGQGGAYDRYLQTDAAINRGNSGGPMFDLNGNVIGINNAIISPTGGSVGIGFAIPAEVAAPIVDKLRSGSAIERGYLGIGIQPLTDDLAASLGLPKRRGEFVQRIEPGQPAEAAGIKAGDVVLSIDGKDVTPDQTLSFIVANIAPGKRIPVVLIRNGQRMNVTATVGKRPSEEELAAQSFSPEAAEDFSDQDDQNSEQATRKALGMVVTDLTPQIARQVGVPPELKGVVVAAVDPSADAATKGIRRGDVILSINNRAVATPADVDRVIAEARAANREAVLLQVQRRGGPSQFQPVRLRAN